VRNGLDRATLVELFAWSEGEFGERMRGLGDSPHRLRAVLRNLPWGSAMLRARPKSSPPCAPESITHHPSFGNTSNGLFPRHERLAA